MRCDNGAEVLLNPLVLSLGKSISLRVERSGQILFDSELLGDGLSKMGSKTWVSIADNLGGKTEPSIHIVEV